MNKRLIIVGALFVCLSYAKVYKYTDNQGGVHFSDIPYPGYEKIEIPEAQTYTSPVSKTGGVFQNRQKQAEQNNDAEIKYPNISIIQPINDATIRNNQGYLAVVVRLKPALAKNDNLQMILDGVPLAYFQESLFFSLQGVYRGRHTLVVRVINAVGETLLSSEPVTFYMQRPRIGMS